MSTQEPSWVVCAVNGPLGFDASTTPAWVGVCAALGLDHLRDDPRCVSAEERLRHQAALLADLEVVTRRWTRHELSLALASEEVEARVVTVSRRQHSH